MNLLIEVCLTVIGYYRLSWQRKLTPVKSSKAEVLWQGANAKTSRTSKKGRNVSFENIYIGQFMLSTQLIRLNYPVILSHRRNTTVSLESYPL